MTFDPDKFLAEGTPQDVPPATGFDPDAFLQNIPTEQLNTIQQQSENVLHSEASNVKAEAAQEADISLADYAVKALESGAMDLVNSAASQITFGLPEIVQASVEQGLPSGWEEMKAISQRAAVIRNERDNRNPKSAFAGLATGAVLQGGAQMVKMAGASALKMMAANRAMDFVDGVVNERDVEDDSESMSEFIANRVFEGVKSATAGAIFSGGISALQKAPSFVRKKISRANLKKLGVPVDFIESAENPAALKLKMDHLVLSMVGAVDSPESSRQLKEGLDKLYSDLPPRKAFEAWTSVLRKTDSGSATFVPEQSYEATLEKIVRSGKNTGKKLETFLKEQDLDVPVGFTKHMQVEENINRLVDKLTNTEAYKMNNSMKIHKLVDDLQSYLVKQTYISPMSVRRNLPGANVDVPASSFPDPLVEPMKRLTANTIGDLHDMKKILNKYNPNDFTDEPKEVMSTIASQLDDIIKDSVSKASVPAAIKQEYTKLSKQYGSYKIAQDLLEDSSMAEFTGRTMSARGAALDAGKKVLHTAAARSAVKAGAGAVVNSPFLVLEGALQTIRNLMGDAKKLDISQLSPELTTKYAALEKNMDKVAAHMDLVKSPGNPITPLLTPLSNAIFRAYHTNNDANAQEVENQIDGLNSVLHLRENPLARDEASLVENMPHIRNILTSQGMKAAADQLDASLSAGDLDSFSRGMNELAKLPQSKGLIQDGYGISGKLMDQDDFDQARFEVRKALSQKQIKPAAALIEMKRINEGMVPQIQPTPPAPKPAPQFMPRRQDGSKEYTF